MSRHAHCITYQEFTRANRWLPNAQANSTFPSASTWAINSLHTNCWSTAPSSGGGRKNTLDFKASIFSLVFSCRSELSRSKCSSIIWHNDAPHVGLNSSRFLAELAGVTPSAHSSLSVVVNGKYWSGRNSRISRRCHSMENVCQDFPSESANTWDRY